MRHFLLSFFCVAFLASGLKASHIVGGEMSYVCLGDNDYQITLKLYRDCYNGQAMFDDPTDITVYDGAGNLYTTLTISFPGSDTLSIITNCGTLPPNLCIEAASFVTTVHLPPTTGGYTLVYQRCCRSLLIENINDPTNAGISVMATIPDPALTDCNSSPVFNIPPPAAFCAYFPISYDQSAVDPDGDSLEYELCSATTGGTSLNPYPVPADPPPYADATYVLPFSGSYPYSANPALSIDPNTGLITGTLTATGIFDLTVCVKEYRNGNLIATHQRDMGQVITFDGDPATGLSQINETPSIDIYPNPAFDLISVDIRGNQNPFEVMNVYDVLGKVVYTEKLNRAINNYQINTSAFPTGIFQVQLIGENISSTKSMLIQK